MDDNNFQDASGCTVTDYKLTFNFQKRFSCDEVFSNYLLYYCHVLKYLLRQGSTSFADRNS